MRVFANSASNWVEMAGGWLGRSRPVREGRREFSCKEDCKAGCELGAVPAAGSDENEA